MAHWADELRTGLQERIREEALADPRVKALERWALRMQDEEVADAIELFMIGLDASRKARWVVLRTIDDEFRQPGELLPHHERVAFLRWIVRSRETDANIQSKLREIREAATPDARSRVIDTIAAAEGANAASIENAHAILAHAWRAAPADARPATVYRGEPEPLLGDKSTVRVMIYMARRCAHLVPRAQKKAFERLLQLAITAIAGGRPDAALNDAIMDAPNVGAMSLARSACLEARSTLTRADMAGVAARPAAARTVALLLEADGEAAVLAFLGDLDEELRRLDVVNALELHMTSPSRPIVRAIHRGAEEKKVVLWLAELEGGQLGVLAKEGRSWIWTEGGYDDILAMIPDAHFERAVLAAKVKACAEAGGSARYNSDG